MIRSKHNNLLNYFIHDRRDLSPAYVRSCEKFFDSICWPKYYGGTNTNGKIYKLNKPQAASSKRPEGARHIVAVTKCLLTRFCLTIETR